MRPLDEAEAPTGAQRGLHIAFQGIDGSGKSTAAGRLTHHLLGRGHRAFCLDSKDEFAIHAMMSAAATRGMPWRRFFGDASELLLIMDALRDTFKYAASLAASGAILVAARSIPGRLAVARMRDSRMLPQLEALAALAPPPDVTFMLDVPVDTALARIAARGTDEEDRGELTRFSAELDRIARDRGWVRVDASGSAESVQAAVRGHLEPLLAERAERLLRLPQPPKSGDGAGG